MPLPINELLPLQGNPKPGDMQHTNMKQAMIVRLTAEMLELLESQPQGSQADAPAVEVVFGDSPVRSSVHAIAESAHSVRRACTLMGSSSLLALNEKPAHTSCTSGRNSRGTRHWGP